MKTKTLSFIGLLLLLFCSTAFSQDITVKNASPQKGTFTISCTPDLYPMASQWVIEYKRVNPDVRIEVINLAGKIIDQGSDQNLYFVTNKSRKASNTKTDWKILVGRDVVVPFMNAANPFLNELAKQGVSQQKFTQIFNNPDKQNWGSLVAEGLNTAVHLYVVNDEDVKAGVAQFLQSTQVPVAGIIFGNKDEVVSAVQNDPYAIGFSKVVDIMGMDSHGLAGNIQLLPLDKNGNGTIDYMEDIYSDVNTFLRGVWIGKYPKSLYSNIYAVSKVQPTNESEMAFLSWVLTDGQQYMNSNGFCSLVNSESQAQLNKINPAVVNVTSTKEASQTRLVLLIVSIVILLGFVISAVVRRNRKQVNAIPDFNDSLTGFNENSVEVPNGIYFNKSHSWSFMEKDGNVSIGIDDFLQHVTGPITRVEMRSPGEKVKKGEFLFSIVQSGKRLSLYSPVSGIIKQQNEMLKEDASIINSSPYSDGWIYRIEPSNWFVEVKFMDMADKYKKWINTEFSRMKDFLAATLKPDSLEYSHVVLQDGGIVKEGVLADFGPEVWDDFQTNFLEIYK
jgi:glycine cleavage system H lipoate-binding protein/ABC-type phosphate transport system substrate-binding protein